MFAENLSYNLTIYEQQQDAGLVESGHIRRSDHLQDAAPSIGSGDNAPQH